MLSAISVLKVLKQGDSMGLVRWREEFRLQFIKFKCIKFKNSKMCEFQTPYPVVNQQGRVVVREICTPIQYLLTIMSFTIYGNYELASMVSAFKSVFLNFTPMKTQT